MKELHDYYVEKHKEYEQSEKVTKTLISKVLLGTLGCIPAFDRYVRDALPVIVSLYPSEYNDLKFSETWTNKKLLISKDAYDALKKFYKDKLATYYVSDSGKSLYPEMKVVDMCLWSIGADISDLGDKFHKENKSWVNDESAYKFAKYIAKVKPQFFISQIEEFKNEKCVAEFNKFLATKNKGATDSAGLKA